MHGEIPCRPSLCIESLSIVRSERLNNYAGEAFQVASILHILASEGYAHIIESICTKILIA